MVNKNILLCPHMYSLFLTSSLLTTLCTTIAVCLNCIILRADNSTYGSCRSSIYDLEAVHLKISHGFVQ
jgi:hypothetical protein